MKLAAIDIGTNSIRTIIAEMITAAPEWAFRRFAHARRPSSQAANLPGTYMAWLSTPQANPASRFVHSTVPYRQTSGVQIADNWTDLVDGTVAAVAVGSTATRT